MMQLKKRIIILLLFSILFIFVLCDTDSDEIEIYQWALTNDGRKVEGIKGRRDVDIDLIRTLELDETSNNIICVIDDYVEFDEKYCKNLNANEDWCSVSNSSHGYYITSIIGLNNFSDKYTSVLNNVMYYSIYYGDENTIEEIIEELIIAEKMGVKVVNCSFVMDFYSEKLYEYIKNSNMLFVCAAGNDGKEMISYPAAYKLDNVVSVAGIDNYGFISKYSNYSKNIDISAPGENILCMDKNGEYVLESGSSLATAYVTAACAYVFNKTDMNALEVKEFVLSCSKNIDSLEGKVKEGRLLSIGNIIENITK